jgi:hypothetical protein
MSIEKFLVIVIAAAIAILSGCGDSGYSGPPVSAGSETTLGVQVVNAADQVPIDNVTATLTITSNADKFNETSVTTDVGIASFTVKDGNDPASEPISVSVKASAEGYLDSNQSTEITTTGAIDLQVELVSTTTTPPTGVGISQQDIGTTGGKPSETINATAGSTASDGSGNQESSNIEIGTNVEMQDANGNPVTGDVSVTVAYYDANSNDALEAFPGGFTVAVENASNAASEINNSDVTGEIESDNQLTFISGGFTAVEIKSGDTKVEKFSKKVPITFNISPDTINPDTNQAVKAGDKLPIWSFNTDTGKWSYEGLGDVAAGDSAGLLKVTYEVDHLSYFNLDWYRAGNKKCYGKIHVLDETGNTYPNYAKVRISLSGQSRTKNYNGDGSIELYNLPADRKATVTFIDSSTGNELGSIGSDLDNLCGTTHTVNLTTPVGITLTNLTVQTVTYCSNDSSVADTAVPSVYVYLAQNSPTWSYVGNGYTNSSGEQVFNNLVTSSSSGNHQYTLKVYDRINSTWRLATDQVFSGDADTYQFRFPQTCDVTTGSTGSTGAEGSGS